MFIFKKKGTRIPKIEYDPNTQQPVIKASICNGEQVVGFKDIATGKFTEVMFLKGEQDLENFKKMYSLTEVTREYW